MQELLEQNSYDKDKGMQTPDPLDVPQMSMEDLQQALAGLQGLEGDVATSQNQMQLNEQQEQILFGQLKNINDALWDIDHELQVNDSRGGWISGVRNAPSVTNPLMPMSGVFSKVAMHQAIYKGTISSKIQEIDKAFSLLNRDMFMSSNKNRGRWLELNKMYLEMANGVGKTYNAIPKIIKDIRPRLVYLNTILNGDRAAVSLGDVRRSQTAKSKKAKESTATVDKQKEGIIMTSTEMLDDLEQKLRSADVSYNDQALEYNVPYFRNLYSQTYEKIKADQTLTPDQRKYHVLRLACIVTGRSSTYRTWMFYNNKKDSGQTVPDYYSLFANTDGSSDGIHDKFAAPDFAEQILHTELLGSQDLSDQETVFSRIINHAGIPVEHKFNTTPQELYNRYGTNPQWNLPDPKEGFDALPYKDRLQYVVLDKFLKTQEEFLKQEMQFANAAGEGPFASVEVFADYLQTSGEVQQYEQKFAELKNGAVVSTGNVVKEKLPEYLKHNTLFGKGVRSKDFPWLTDRCDRAILDVYQSIMGTGWEISDSNAMAIKEGAKIVGQIGLSIAAGFVIPGGWLAGLSTVARLAVTASVMATTNVIAHQVINRPDYVDPFEAITDVSTQLVFDFGTTFLGGVAMQKFGYGFKSFAQTFSKRGSINWALSLGDLTLGTVAENFRQSFFMENPPMGFWEQFKSPIGWIGFIFMMFGVKNLNKAERSNLKKNYAKLSQYVKENPQIRSMHLDFIDINGTKQFITVGELLDAIDLKKGVKLTKVPALSADVDKFKPVQKIDAHTQRVHDNAALGEEERPGALEKQLQEEGLLGTAEKSKSLTQKQKTGINTVHDLSIKSLDEIEAVYNDKTSYEGEGSAKKLTAAAKKKIAVIIAANNPDDQRPAVLQHTIAQMQTKKKILQDIYNFDKKQAHYLVKSGGVGYPEGKTAAQNAQNALEITEKMLDNDDSQFIVGLGGKTVDTSKIEGIILKIKQKIAQIDREIEELNREIAQMRRELNTKKKGSEQEERSTKIAELENTRNDLQKRRAAVMDRYKTKLSRYREYLADTCMSEVDKMIKSKESTILLDEFTELDNKTSAQLEKALKEIKILEDQIKKLEDKYFGSKFEAGLADADNYSANYARDRKRHIEQRKQEIANRKRKLTETRNKRVAKEKAIVEAKQAADAVDTKIKTLEKKKDKLTDGDITDLETDISKLERKHSGVIRDEVGGRSKKTTLEERIETQRKKLAELKKARETAKFKKKYDDDLYDEYYKIDRDANNKTLVPDSRMETLEKKIETFERENTGKLDAEYRPGKTYKQHIADMRERLAEIKTLRKNAGIAEVEGDMNRALGEIDHFVATQLDPTITSPSTLDLPAAKSRLALAKAKLERLKDQIKKESGLDNRHPSTGKKREEHLLDQDQKLKTAEQKIARQELHDDTVSVDTAVSTLETQFHNPAHVQADSFGAANDRIGKLETELRSKGLLKERMDPDDPTSPTYEQHIQTLRDRVKAAKLEYDKFKVNIDISNIAGDGIDDKFSDYNAHPDRADVTNDKLNELEKQLNNLEGDVKKNGLADQMRTMFETYDQYIRRMRGELLKLRQKIRVAKAALQIHNTANNGIDDLQHTYNIDRDRASVENVEALERRLETLETEVKEDIDQAIPGRTETYRQYIVRKKVELADLKKNIKDHHANKSADAVRTALRRYEQAVENAGMFLDDDEILRINTRKQELDRAMTEADKKGGKEKLDAEETTRIESANKKHDTIISSKIDATQFSRDVDPVLQEYVDGILLHGGDMDPTDFEHMIKLQFAKLLHGLTGGVRRTKILEMISDAYVLDMLLKQGYFKNFKPEQIKLLIERNARIIQIMERYKKAVRIEYIPGDPTSGIDPSFRESHNMGIKAYDLTFQEFGDGARLFASYPEIQKKYQSSSNPEIRKFGDELGSRLLKFILGGGTTPDKIRDDAEKSFDAAYKELGKKPVEGQKGLGIDSLDVVFAAMDTEILSLVRRAGPVFGWLFEKSYALLKFALTNERFGTVASTTFGYLHGGPINAAITWFISNPLFSRRYLRRVFIVIEQAIWMAVAGHVEGEKRQDKVETYLESRHLKRDYDHYLAPEIIDGDKDAQKIKKRVDTRLGDDNPKNDEGITLELIEYLKYVKFIEALEVGNKGYDPVFKKYILDMSDFDRKRFTRDRTEQELLDPATIQNIIANKLREQYIGKRKSEIPLWILDASGVNDKFVKKAKSTIEIRNYNERQTYRDIISSDPWIQDFIDEDQYNKIVQQQDYGANDTEPQDVNLSLTPKPSITIESIPKCPESIQYTLESLVDQAGDPNEEFEYEGRVMSGNNRTPRRAG